MSWRIIFKKIPAISIGGAAFYCFLKLKEPKIVNNSWTTNFVPSQEWDFNWDHRASTSILKPLPENATPEQENAYNEKLNKYRSKAIRHIIMIRHGQYNLNGATDQERYLTDLGRQQAKLTGQRLAELKIPIDDVVISTMMRAQETGTIILKQLPQHSSVGIKNDPLIEEGAPIAPVPELAHWNPEPHEFFQEGSRIEAGFRSHIHRADPSQQKDSYTLMVCHGNVIRYFVCRALQLPPEAWLRFNIHHASITWLVIYPNGRVVLRLFGDCGHMSKPNLSIT